MKDDNVVREKSRAFAIRIINLYKYLVNEKKEFVLSKQLLRCGTSIGANIAEGICAFSKKDFLSKLYISFKECVETEYWIDLLYSTDYMTKEQFDSMDVDCIELRKILSSITKTTAENLNIK